METKYLWDRVDALRDALKDIKEENDDLIAENKHLKLRVEELDGFSDDVDVERSRAEVENDKLKAELNDFKSNYVWSDEVDKLKAENDDLKAENCGLINESKWDKNKLIKELQAENDSLKDEAVKWNRKYNKLNANYNNDIDASYELDDKHIKIIKDLEEEIKTLKDSSRYPKEYQKESEEYFHHNPQAKSLHFFIKDDDDCINENIDVDDAICTIYKS